MSTLFDSRGNETMFSPREVRPLFTFVFVLGTTLFLTSIVGGADDLRGVSSESQGRKAGTSVDFQPSPGFVKLPDGMRLGACSAVAVNSKGEVFVFHRGQPPIIVLDANGEYLRSFGQGEIITAHGLRIDPDDNVWVTDIGGHRVLKFDASGKLLLALGTGKAGDRDDQFNKPTDIAFGPRGEIFISDGYGNSRVMVFTAQGQLIRQWGRRGKGRGEFNLPHSILVDRRGRVLVGDRENNRIQIFDREGALLEIWNGFAPYGMAFDPEGQLFVADGRANKILRLDEQGHVVQSWGKKGTAAGQFEMPHMLGFDQSGNLYVAEVRGERLQKLIVKPHKSGDKPQQQSRRDQTKGNIPRGPAPGKDNIQVVQDPTGFLPLIDLGTKTYKGWDGGLYGDGKNEPPVAHRTLAGQALKKIQPLDAEGKPAADGKIVMMSIGMSNTTMEFMKFKQLADADPAKSPHVLIVDTAQGGRTAGSWANSLSGNTKRSNVPLKDEPYQGTPGENQSHQEEFGAKHTVWEEADRRIRGAGATPQQVQVVWIKLAGSVRLGFPEHIQQYQGHLATIVRLAKSRYPNLQIAYLSSRVYAGYATTMLNPEPWSYESAFGVRGLIQQQIENDLNLNADPARGPVKAPVLLWGPYLWADGTKPRSDGLIWKRKDLARDGIHPTRTGTRKVGEHLLRFLKTDPLARPWFTGKSDDASELRR